jgi:hypothetical protein
MTSTNPCVSAPTPCSDFNNDFMNFFCADWMSVCADVCVVTVCSLIPCSINSLFTVIDRLLVLLFS